MFKERIYLRNQNVHHSDIYTRHGTELQNINIHCFSL